MATFKDKNKRPQAKPSQLHNVPDELRQVRQWCLWRYDWDDARGEWAKVPYQVNGRHAKSNDPDTWSTYAEAVNALLSARSTYDGAGFVFSKDSAFVGIDLDECVTVEDDQLILTTFAERAVEKLSSYTELSPSGTGLHIIGRAGDIQALKQKWHGNAIEVYRTGRYFTFTGLSWHEAILPVRDVHSDLEQILDAVRQAKASNGNGQAQQGALGVQGQLQMALRQERIKKLFHGGIDEYGGDDSRADLALCSMLAQYCNGNVQILDEMFRASGLMRSKWDEMRGAQTYGEMTLTKAMTGRISFTGKRPAAMPVESTVDSRRPYRFGVDDLFASAMEYRSNPLNKGVSPGWKELERLYRPRLGLLSVITGAPSSGKSTFTDVMTYFIARHHGWKILYASFETQPLERHFLDLAQIHLQKPTFAFVDFPATDAEMVMAQEEMREHFRFIGPQDNELNIDSVLEYVEDEIRENCISGFVLDPWSELDNSRDLRQIQTEFIESGLRKLRSFTRHHQIHTWLIAHPAKGNDAYKTNRVTLRDISGSRHYENKADYGLVIERNDDSTTTVYVDKVRFSEVGERGELTFSYDRRKRMYYPAGVTVEEDDQEGGLYL